MKEYNKRYNVKKMARVLGVSRSGYYAWVLKAPSKREKEDIELSEMIAKIFKDHYGRYGSPRVFEEMKACGQRIGRKRVARLMREKGLFARKHRKYIKTTESSHSVATAQNIINRDFFASQPGEKWVSDITYVMTNSGWLYLTVIIDLYDRKVIGWSMGNELIAKYVCRALEMATMNRQPKDGLIFHSDRGIQYCSEEFTSTLKRLCPSSRQSMSRKGNCWDNACAESFFKTLKVELNLSKRRCNAEQTKSMIFEYIEIYYNRCRRHSTLGYAIPITYQKNLTA